MVQVWRLHMTVIHESREEGHEPRTFTDDASIRPMTSLSQRHLLWDCDGQLSLFPFLKRRVHLPPELWVVVDVDVGNAKTCERIRVDEICRVRSDRHAVDDCTRMRHTSYGTR